RRTARAASIWVSTGPTTRPRALRWASVSPISCSGAPSRDCGDRSRLTAYDAPLEEAAMRIVDLSMTVEEWDSTPFAPEEAYFKLRPIVRWEDKGFVSNMVEMTVHAGTHIDSPHHFVREHPGVAELPVEHMVSDAVVLDLTFRGQANARITPDDLDQAERALNAPGHRLLPA